MTLSEIAMKHECNKCPDVGGGGHSYTPFYEVLFAERKVQRLLEIGIWQGNSLRMWEEFFPEAEIIGIDIDPASLVNAGRIRSYLCDQNDEDELRDLMMRVYRRPDSPEANKFDVIIDDGSHRAVHQITSANALVPWLAAGGIYVIEDVYPDHVDKLRRRLPLPTHVIDFEYSKLRNGADNDRLVVMYREEGSYGEREEVR